MKSLAPHFTSKKAIIPHFLTRSYVLATLTPISPKISFTILIHKEIHIQTTVIPTKPDHSNEFGG